MAYCNQDDIEDILSEAGVSYSSADVGDGPDTDVVNNTIERAESLVKQALRKKYDTSTITRANNTWVKWCTATYAAVSLMRRRGNSVPDGLWVMYQEYKETLAAVKAGTEDIPDLDPRYEPGLTMSNHHISHWPRSAKSRVITSTSVGQQDSQKPRKRDLRDWPDYYG